MIQETPRQKVCCTSDDAIDSDREVDPSVAPRPKRKQSPLKIGALVVLIAAVTAWNVYYGSNLWSSETQLSHSLGQHAQVWPQIGSRSFDLSNATIPEEEIFAGGPPKDGIPALTDPQLIAANKADYLQADDRVIGVAIGEDARAYPLRILNYHEVVNDRVAGVPIAATYCPLCDSAAVFDRRTELGEREFGVSGLLYNSNVLIYDRSEGAESLWSQVMAQGVTGPGADKRLRALPLELTSWSDWKSRYPHTRVLSIDTGHRRSYGRNPYATYFKTSDLMFPAEPVSDALPTKSPVLGVWVDGAARAYPVAAFSDERPRVEDRLGGKRVVVEFDPQSGSLRVVEADDGVQWMYALWFAWYAFHPETDVSGSG